MLLAHALGVPRTALFLRREAPVPERFAGLIARRAAREPVAYIVGAKGFRHLELDVDGRALVPRPETEHLVEAALGLPAGARVVDVGTGSGALALALKHERPDLEFVGTDSSAAALDVARSNGARLGLDVGWVQGDLLAGVGPVDAVVSNPPYVATGSALPPELEFEPSGALLAGAEGMDVLERLVPAAAASGAAFVAVEVGDGQAAAVAALFGSAVEVVPDLAGVDRVLVWRC
ncbi:MAG: peptide chain release factor N(5)-glutamine methyltransferase [Solirubrobacteraceae bacterium]